jgi:subtilase family serine protease
MNFVWQHGYVDPGAASDTIGSGLSETDLDVQAATGMAPNVSAITLYYAQDTLFVDLVDALGQWLNDPTGALQLSASFGGCETLDFILEGNGFDAGFAQAIAEGRTVFASSGDNGAGCENPSNASPSPILDAIYPASSPFVVAVGGTVVSETTHNSATSEYAWDASGGGTSLWEPAPAYQQHTVLGRCLADPSVLSNGGEPPVTWLLNINPPTPPGPPPTNLIIPPPGTGAICRGVPDVAAQSGDGLSGMNDFSNGVAGTAAGTSLAAPLWQGMWARVNAAAPAGDTVGAGFAGPLLYGLGSRTATDFNDITVGDNGPYPALPGWDYVSGFGSPSLTNLMTDIDGGTAPTNPTAGPPASPPPPPCPSPQISDPAGDATQLVVVDPGQSAASQQDLDVRTGNLSWNGSTLTAVITVTNLSAAAPNGQSSNEFFRYLFTSGGTWYLSASRSASGTTFTIASNGLTGTSAAVSGTFDPATNTVTITMPAAALHSIGGPTLGSGQAITAMSIDAQREVGTFTLTADTATTSCTYVLP